jgi:hypothetical protein
MWYLHFMTVDSTPIMRRSKTNRSATTNGNRQFAQGGDGRGAWVRRWRDLTELHIADLGPESSLSEGQLSLCRRAATIEVQLEQMEAAMSLGDPVEFDVYNRGAGNLRRILESIGLERTARTVNPIESLEAIPFLPLALALALSASR